MEFVAAVSHELRTPVSVIGAAAGNLADGVVGDPQRVRKYGETIQGEARRLAETVERVLQLAGIAAGSAAASRAPVPPADLVQRVARRVPAGDRVQRASTSRSTIADDLPNVHRRRRRAAVGAAEPDQQRGEVRRRRAMGARHRAALGTRAGPLRIVLRVDSRSKTRASASTPRIASTSSSRSIAAAKPSRSRSRAAASASTW